MREGGSRFCKIGEGWWGGFGGCWFFSYFDVSPRLFAFFLVSFGHGKIRSVVGFWGCWRMGLSVV